MLQCRCGFRGTTSSTRAPSYEPTLADFCVQSRRSAVLRVARIRAGGIRERGPQESDCSVDAAMTIRRRTGLILVGIACALLVVLIFLVPVLLNADRYRAKVISYLEEKTGKKVEIGRLAVTFFPGVAIQVGDFGVKSQPLFPPSYIVKVARIDAQLDVGALLHRQVVIKSLVV